jgi:hypothetical protein
MPKIDTSNSKAPKKTLNDVEISQLKQKNTNALVASAGISFLGNIGGLMYAINTKKSGWGKVGYFFLGGILVGIPISIATSSYIRSNNKKIDILDIQNSKITTAMSTPDKEQEKKENEHFNQGGGFN